MDDFGDLFIAALILFVVLSATNKGLYRSTNAGATWSLLTLPTGLTGVPYIWTMAWTGGSFAISLEATPGVATGTTNGQIMVTGDNGNTWTKASGFTKTSGVGRTSLGGALLVAKTSDGGSTFTQKSNWLAQFSLAYVHPDFHTSAMSGTTRIVGTDGGLFKSTDGGLTFAAANTGITESNNSSTAPINTGITTWEGAANADTIFTWSNARIYKSVNYAGSWTAMGVTGLPTTSFYIRGVGVAASNVNALGIVANGGESS